MHTLVSLFLHLAGTAALPLPQSPESTLAIEVDQNFRRPLFNIVWSAIVTIASCTYSAIHPNVPNPGSTTREVFQERLQLTLYAVLGPDMMILWAVMQRKAAHEIFEHFKNRKEIPQWTMTHAFFLQMGGFMINIKDRYYQVLTPMMLENLINPVQKENDAKEGEQPVEKINQATFMLRVSEQEIKHRSKGDVMAMVIAVAQTSWFLIQCAVRFAAHLNVTMLELTALAFAILNMITWIVWYNKPHHVRLPIYLDYQGKTATGPDFELKGWDLGEHAPTESQTQTQGEASGQQGTSSQGDASVQPAKKGATKLILRDTGVLSYLINPLMDAIGLEEPEICKKVVIYRPADSEEQEYKVENVDTYHTSQFNKALKPTDDTVRPLRSLGAILGSTIAAIFFGGIHCVGWASVFEFPTKEERLLWTISSTAITLIPAASFFAVCLHFCYKHFAESNAFLEKFKSQEENLVYFVFYVGSIPFILARLVIIVLAFTTLRSLPPSAFDTIRWVSMFPHI